MGAGKINGNKIFAQKVESKSAVQGSKSKGSSKKKKEPVDSYDLSAVKDEAGVLKDWSILHYVSADNDLQDFLVGDVNDLENVGSTDNMHIIAMLDRGEGNCKIYYIKKDDDPENITSPVIRDMGEVDMTNPKVFKEFVADMGRKFPAKHYAVIVGSHGAGWEGAVDDNLEYMPTPVIGKAFSAAAKELGQKIDIAGFDACQMGAAEVAFELEDSVNYLVSSQEVLGGAGWAYTPFLSALDKAMAEGKEVIPQEFAGIIVEHAKIDKNNIPAKSVMNLEKLGLYRDAVNKFSQAILDTDTPNKIFKNIANQTQHFDDRDMKDHYHFAQLTAESKDIKDEKVKESARELMKVIKEELITANRSFEESYSNAHGIAVLVEDVISEEYRGAFDMFNYRDIKLAKQTLWDEAVSKFMKEE